MSRADTLEEIERRSKLLLRDVAPILPGVKTLLIDGISISENRDGIMIATVQFEHGMTTDTVVYSNRTDAHTNLKWRVLESVVLPVLRKATVLDDLANA